MKKDWQTYLARGEHKLTKDQQTDMMTLWTAVADALSPVEVKQAIERLESTQLWKNAPESVTKYFKNHGLSGNVLKLCKACI